MLAAGPLHRRRAQASRAWAGAGVPAGSGRGRLGRRDPRAGAQCPLPVAAGGGGHADADHRPGAQDGGGHRQRFGHRPHAGPGRHSAGVVVWSDAGRQIRPGSSDADGFTGRRLGKRQDGRHPRDRRPGRARQVFALTAREAKGTIGADLIRPRDGDRSSMDIKDHIRGIPDFPKPGILFYDISTLLAHPDAWQVAMGRMSREVRKFQPDLLAGVESRGFLAAAPLALKLGCGFSSCCARRASCPARPSSTNTAWNTAPTPSRSRKTPFNPASAWWSSTICWPPAAP
ncbi:hypothetical protein MTBLM5_40064 [Magnetospirillum sp. LM-5]|nr:hypothetical protein MTBLM5_40064 [Magnetospirillum sp. LM-5]